MTEYQIEEEFKTDPELRGWKSVGAIPNPISWDNTKEAVGGDFADAPVGDRALFVKNVLGMTLNDGFDLETIFDLEVSGTTVTRAFIGFFNSTDYTKGLFISIEQLKVNAQIWYSDGTNDIGVQYTIEEDKKYRAVLRFNPSDMKIYLDIYEALTDALLFSDSFSVNSSKELYVDWVGFSTYEQILPLAEQKLWSYSLFALSSEGEDYNDLYCTPSEARQLTNMDSKEFSDADLIQLQRLFVKPSINTIFRAEGYLTPFDAGDDTPPLIRALAAILTAGYAAKKAYTGHQPNEAPAYTAMMDEAKAIYKRINLGEMELQKVDGTTIPRIMPTSSDMLSTSEGKTNIFSLEDVPYTTEGLGEE